MFKYFREKRLRERRQFKRVLGGMLIFFAVANIVMSFSAMMRMTWPTTMGVVTETEVKLLPKTHHEPSKTARSRSVRYDKDGNLKEKYKPKPEYVLKVGYKYTVDGEEFTGKDSKGTSKDNEKLLSLAEDKYPAGKKVQVTYNPGDHTECHMGKPTFFMIMMFWVVACGLAFGGWKLVTIKEPQQIPSEDF